MFGMASSVFLPISPTHTPPCLLSSTCLTFLAAGEREEDDTEEGRDDVIHSWLKLVNNLHFYLVV